jgi:SAM-dependent methyltransferase
MTDAPSPQQLADGWNPVAAGYDEEFARFTGGYSDDLLDLVGLELGEHVLDVAAGTGAFTIRAARLGAAVTATDFAPGMVGYLQQKVETEGLDRVSTAVMDGQALDLPDDSFDLTVSMFGVIFFPDIDRGLAEMARVTRSRGRVCVSTWDLAGFRLMELVQQAFLRVVPGFSAPTTTPAWARIGDPAGLEAALRRVGLDPVHVHSVTRRWTWDDPAAFFRRMPSWSPPAQPLFAAMDDATIDAAAAAFVDVLAELDGPPNSADASALLGIGTKP